MAQTPQQRRANAKYAKTEEEKRGKPLAQQKKRDVERSPISTGWVAVLAVLLVGGVLVELLRLWFS